MPTHEENHLAASITALVTRRTRMAMMSLPKGGIGELLATAPIPETATMRPAQRAPAGSGAIADYP